MARHSPSFDFVVLCTIRRCVISFVYDNSCIRISNDKICPLTVRQNRCIGKCDFDQIFLEFVYFIRNHFYGASTVAVIEHSVIFIDVKSCYYRRIFGHNLCGAPAFGNHALVDKYGSKRKSGCKAGRRCRALGLVHTLSSRCSHRIISAIARTVTIICNPTRARAISS